MEEKPTLEGLTEKVPSKYTLVILAAKRAREITAGSRIMAGSIHDKPVISSLKEIAAGKIRWQPAEKKKEGS
ncbi:MAG: DNA-directed RNA polymerase subunit omega [Bacillota bacterium]|nr:DNA-directed RNA polymerase subunit omega [Bacillota bacterium]